MPAHGPVGQIDAHHRGPLCGFTMVELLVVISILVLLGGMLMSLLGVAQRSAAKTNTMSLMQKVHGALGMFRIDAGGHPFQAWDAAVDPPPAASTDPPANQLAYHLFRNLTPAELGDLRADIDTVGNAYENGGSAFIPTADFNMPKNTVWTGTISTTNGIRHINRVAKQWATANIMVGNVSVGKPTRNASDPWIYGAPLLAAPRSRGFASDYLSGELQARNRSGDAIVDMWGSPLLYLCPVQPGVTSYMPEDLGLNFLDPAWFGMAPRSLRAATTELASDMRTTAPARFATQPELWSRGPDRSMASGRTAPINKDNIPAFDYHKELR